jgi:hypothetical protein
MAQWLYLLIAGLTLSGIAWLCAGLCVLLLGLTRSLGKGFETRARPGEPIASAPAAK